MAFTVLHYFFFNNFVSLQQNCFTLMGKNKLEKFADMAGYPHVFQYPYAVTEQIPFELQGHWHKAFFHNDKPIVLELGCGRGEYTVGLAQRYPDKNFIGVDIKGARMWTGATQSLNEGMTNVAFLRTNIEIIDRFFAAGEVSEIWLTFPDPQMKKVTKRLTSTFFMERYRHFLIDKGLVHLKTDSNFMFTYTRYMLEENHITPLCVTDDLYGTSKDERLLSIQTYYEQQWLSRGLNIKYILFELPQNIILQESDREIELDEYRSFNRSKRSGLQTSK